MRIIKFLVAVLLLPTVFFALVETGQILLTVLGHFWAAGSFLAGAVVYGVIHYYWYDFSRPYVFIHEMTHALAALLCGGRIKDVSVGKDSGYVKMNKANVFIALAPYFVPGYVVLTALIYLIADLFVQMAPYRAVFLFAAGFFTAFHWVQTIKTLWEADQPDLELAGGKLFSVVLIGLANLLVLVLVLKSLFPEMVALSTAARRVWTGSVNAWRILVNYIVERIQAL